MSKHTSSNKDPNSDTSQLPISQEFLKAIQGSLFRSQAISYFMAFLEQAVSTWSLQMSTSSFTERFNHWNQSIGINHGFNHCLLEARREKEGAQSTKTPPISPLKHSLLDPRRDRTPGKTTFHLTQLTSPMRLHFAPSIHRPINA